MVHNLGVTMASNKNGLGIWRDVSTTAFKGLTTNAANPARWLVEFFGGGKSSTGIRVNSETALGLAPVIYAVNKISGHVSQLPIGVYKQSDGMRTLARNSPAYRLLNVRPNDVMRPFTFREQIMVHALINGNGRAWIERDRNGIPKNLIPVSPQSCQTLLVAGEKWHLVTSQDAWASDQLPTKLRKGEYFRVPDRDMLHIMNTSYNGVWGMHVIDLAKDVFGLTQGGQAGAASLMANSGRPGVIINAPPGMFRNAKDAQEFLDNFNNKHEGISNSGKAGLLRDGMTATTLPFSAADAEFLANRNFQREEIALLFGLESIMGDNSGQTYRSITERNVAYINNTLQRWFCKWEQEISTKLSSDRTGDVKFDTTQLLKGDPNTLAQYTASLSQQGAVTINEVREIHSLEPVEGGDMLPHEMALEIAEQTQPAEESTEDAGEDNNVPEQDENNAEE